MTCKCVCFAQTNRSGVGVSDGLSRGHSLFLCLVEVKRTTHKFSSWPCFIVYKVTCEYSVILSVQPHRVEPCLISLLGCIVMFLPFCLYLLLGMKNREICPVLGQQGHKSFIQASCVYQGGPLRLISNRPWIYMRQEQHPSFTTPPLKLGIILSRDI